MNSFIGWIGGKRQLRNTILQQFPVSTPSRYIEVFGGAGWVLFGKMQHADQMEVFNDFDGDLINIYRCIKYHRIALQEELSSLPDSRELFNDFRVQESMRGLTDLQRAARSLFLIKTSFGSDRHTFATAPKSLAKTVSILEQVETRLQKVIIENLDFARLISIYDRDGALFYCDPPYVGAENYYRAPFGSQDHIRLSESLHSIKGRFLVSYNDCPLVRELYSDCSIVEVKRKNALSATTVSDYKELIIRNYNL